MPAPWFEADPETLAAAQQALRDRYPTLSFEIRERVAFLTGRFPLANESGRVVDEFEIELRFPHDLARAVPTLREVGGRVPYGLGVGNADRHVNFDGTACLFVEAEFWFSHPDGYTVMEFLEGPVYHWLLGQVMYDADGEWPWPAWSHGPKGILECYAEILGVEDPTTIARFTKVLERKRIKGHWRCPCGSGEQLRHCCNERIKDLRERLPRRVFKKRRQRR